MDKNHITMDYKEKLRLAKEALASNSYDKKTIEYIFPELKENEDERIRKALKSFFDSEISDYGNVEWRNGIRYGEIVDWLEKQGEQKPEIKYIYPKFRVGDVIEPAKPNGHYVPVRVKYIGEGAYSCESDDRTAFLSLPMHMENDYVLTKQKPAEWSEEDEQNFKGIINEIEANKNNAPDYDLATYNRFLSWLKSLKQRMKGE